MNPKLSTHLIVLILLLVLGIFIRCEMFQPKEPLPKASITYWPTPSHSDDPYFQYLFNRLNSDINKASILAQMDSLYAVGNIRFAQLNNQLLQQQSTASCELSLAHSVSISRLKDSLVAIKMCRNAHQIQVIEAVHIQSNQQLIQTKIWCYCLVILLFFVVGSKVFPSLIIRNNAQRDTSLILNKEEDLEDKSTEENAGISSPNTIQEEALSANEEFITLTNREKTRLKLADIIYVQADSGGVNYHTTHGVYFNWQSLKSCLHLLPEPSFVQISKTVVVARLAIIGKTKSMVRVINNTELNIGRAFQDKISDK